MSQNSRTRDNTAVTVRLATVFDIRAIARCWYHAFFNDVVIGDMMHPHRKEHPEDVYCFLLRGVRERYFDWTHQFVVATVNDRVIGAADWRRLGTGGENLQLRKMDPRNLIAPAISLWNALSLQLYPNRAADPARSSFLDSAVEASKQYWTDDRAECWDLHVCGVHPDWQGKGVGNMLVGWGTTKADGEGVFCSVITGESKRGFYEKSGFVLYGAKKSGEGIILFRTPSARVPGN